MYGTIAGWFLVGEFGVVSVVAIALNSSPNRTSVFEMAPSSHICLLMLAEVQFNWCFMRG